MSKAENKRERTAFRKELIRLGLKRADMHNEDNADFSDGLMTAVDIIIKNDFTISFDNGEVTCYDDFGNTLIEDVTPEAVIEYIGEK